VPHANPNTSVREIADKMAILKSIIFYIFSTRFGYFTQKHVVVPHALLEAQRTERIESYNTFFPFWQMRKCALGISCWRGTNLVSLFYIAFKDMASSRWWCPWSGKAIDQSPKVMMTIFWNSISLHVPDRLLHGNSFDTIHSIDNVFAPIK
jgi:hypothetical protein